MRWYCLGGGGHARQVLDAASRAGLGHPAGFFDTTDVTPAGPSEGGELPCLGGWPAIAALAAESEPLYVALAFGANTARLASAQRLLAMGARLLTVIDAASVVADACTVGAGSVVLARAVIGPACTVGAACIIDIGALVPHDCVVADGAHLAPGAVLGGHVEVGQRTLVGLGAVVRDRVRIGDDCTIGAGAVVVRDVPAGATVFGVPARIYKPSMALR